VQLGSFASKANAERLVKEWEGRGQHGMTAPVKAANGTLYRVRLGPFMTRDSADEVLRKVKPTVAGAAVVAHP
jgi:cell division septation protein DedD